MAEEAGVTADGKANVGLLGLARRWSDAGHPCATSAWFGCAGRSTRPSKRVGASRASSHPSRTDPPPPSGVPYRTE